MNKQYENTILLNDERVVYLRNADPLLGVVFDAIGSLTYSLDKEPFEFLVQTVIGQMLSKTVANRMYEKLLAACNGRIDCASVTLLSDEDIRAIGLSANKANAIRTLAKSHSVEFYQQLSLETDDVVTRKLTKMKGIGPWSAKMYLIFVLDRQDVLPFEDGAFLQSFSWLYGTKELDREAIIKRCLFWKPYSSIAARYLYRALDTGLTKSPVECVVFDPSNQLKSDILD
jgi:DNA-3-methyladenine glycosylase II